MFGKLTRKKPISEILRHVGETESDTHPRMKRHLGVRDLTAFGIAAIIGHRPCPGY